MIGAINGFLQSALDPFGLIANALKAPAANAAASAAIAGAAVNPAAAAAAEGYSDFLAEAYTALPKLNALAFKVITSPLRLGIKLIGGLLRAQGRILRGLGGLLNVAGIDAEQVSTLGYGVNSTGLPLPLPKGFKGFPALPKLAPFPKFAGPFPAFAPPKGAAPLPGAAPPFAPLAPFPKFTFPKGPKGFAPKGYNGTAKGYPKLPKGGPLGFLGTVLEQEANFFKSLNRNSTVKGVKGRPRLPKLAPKLPVAPPAPAVAPPAAPVA